ncbi:MAG: hypothetical protein QOH65_622 [Methylobacteriaceae bacterium]|jgi:aspartate/methionine/tyrosine aminotransferase|nr:hypothetical protein [Methylobacteriaceae bacterium]
MDALSEAAALERQGRRIIHMEVGEPAAPPPRVVREAAIAALGGGRVGYTEALGLPSLRAAIARSYRNLYGVEVPGRARRRHDGSVRRVHPGLSGVF